jgi:lactate dehydrogenase-like 2-hydroxyacid dehydrogenase
MRKPVLVVTAYFVDAVEARLKQDFDLRRKKSGARFTLEELLSAADGADAMLVNPSDKLDAEFFSRVASSVKVIATHSAGYHHIDLSAAAARKVAIANISALSTDAVADLTLILLLRASRRAYEALQVVRSRKWNPSDLTLLLGWQLTGKILGIYGMGRIGQAVAKRARGFGMKIHYHDPHRLPPQIEEGAIFHDNPYDLLRVSPFLSLNAPETKQTHHFLDAKAIACLPRGAVVVNAARGGMVVDEDLIGALKSGQVAVSVRRRFTWGRRIDNVHHSCSCIMVPLALLRLSVSRDDGTRHGKGCTIESSCAYFVCTCGTGRTRCVDCDCSGGPAQSA